MEWPAYASFYVASIFSPFLFHGAFSLCCYYLGAAPTLSSAFVTWLLVICCCHIRVVSVFYMTAFYSLFRSTSRFRPHFAIERHIFNTLSAVASRSFLPRSVIARYVFIAGLASITTQTRRENEAPCPIRRSRKLLQNAPPIRKNNRG